MLQLPADRQRHGEWTHLRVLQIHTKRNHQDRFTRHLLLLLVVGGAAASVHPGGGSEEAAEVNMSRNNQLVNQLASLPEG